VSESGLQPGQLPGAVLEAEANCRAETGDGLVLTKIRVAPDVPDGASPEAGQGEAR